MNSVKKRWHNFWEQRFFRWVDKRAPRTQRMRLNRNNLYIFPNLSGGLFLVVIAVIWALGTNYQNNLVLATSYLLVSLFVVAIYHTYANMAGMNIAYRYALPGFAGDDIGFVLELTCAHKHGCHHLELRWPKGDSQVIGLSPNEPQLITLWAKNTERGYFRPGRLLVQSHFPLGIIRCWTWINLDACALVYPSPIACDEPHAQTDNGAQDGGKVVSGGDDFYGLRAYQEGDPIKHIAWKQYAQEKGLFSKQYQHTLSAEKWLDWNSLTLTTELRLSGLCHWALFYEQKHIPYGLALPGLTIEPSLGEAHQQAVLSALATFGVTDNPNASATSRRESHNAR